MRYERTRRRVAFAPIPVSIYASLLDGIRRTPGIVTPPFSTTSAPAGKIRLYLRHDVDTGLCIDRLPLLLDINLQAQILSPVFIRTDGIDYKPTALSAIVKIYRQQGVEFGLHTSCYLSDDFLDAFKFETSVFEKTFGFRPSIFTVHGMGKHRVNVRSNFVEKISTVPGCYGYEFTDAIPEWRSYDYVVTDCHPDSVSGNRFIYDDFLHLPRFFSRDKDYLILTHPCYWSP